MNAQKCLLCLEPCTLATAESQRLAASHLLGALAELHKYQALLVDIVLLGQPTPALHSLVSSCSFVGQLLQVDPEPNPWLAEDLAPWLAHIAGDYTYVVFGATTWSKDLLPRLAALMDIQPITDVVAIVDANQFVRPVYAGSALETLSTHQATRLLSVRISAFSSFKGQVTSAQRCPLQVRPGPVRAGLSQWLDEVLTATERPELTTARIVVAGGRGLQSAENFILLYELADVLGAAVGASRAAVDACLVGNDLQVGQTGKVVAPELYLAVGLSGAAQHIAGMRDSKTIVAINKDPDAPIFQVADYGLVADLFDVLPELITRLKAIKA